jgi:hypothetical protein
MVQPLTYPPGSVRASKDAGGPMGLVEAMPVLEIEDLRQSGDPLRPLESLMALGCHRLPPLSARQWSGAEEREEVGRMRSDLELSYSFMTRYGFVDALEGVQPFDGRRQ